jgi:hypothetical protein
MKFGIVCVVALAALVAFTSGLPQAAAGWVCGPGGCSFVPDGGGGYAGGYAGYSHAPMYAAPMLPAYYATPAVGYGSYGAYGSSCGGGGYSSGYGSCGGGGYSAGYGSCGGGGYSAGYSACGGGYSAAPAPRSAGFGIGFNLGGWGW